MYTFVKSSGWQEALRREGTPLALSLLVAEVFYKFHSFVLECVAFLATWYVFSWLARMVTRR